MRHLICLMILSMATHSRILPVKQTAGRAPDRMMFDLPNETQPEYYLQQLQNTHQNMNVMMAQERRQGELKNIANNFNDLQHRLNVFRDNLNRKLNEFEMSLQHPKIPMIGPGPLMMHPHTNPMMNAASTIPNNPMNTFAGLTSFMPAPTFSTSVNAFSSNFSNTQNQIPGTQNPVAASGNSISQGNPEIQRNKFNR